MRKRFLPYQPDIGTTNKDDAPTATSKISFSDETTIKTAVASAIQELETQYEKKLQDLSRRLTAKLRKLEDAISKFETMDSKLDLIVDRLLDPHSGKDPNDIRPSSTGHGYNSYHTVTSTPTRKTKRQDTKSTPTVTRTNPPEVPQTQDDESTVMDYDVVYQRDDYSATSTRALEGRDQSRDSSCHGVLTPLVHTATFAFRRCRHPMDG